MRKEKDTQEDKNELKEKKIRKVRIIDRFIQWFNSRKNKFIFDHYVFPYITIEELSKHSFEELADFYFFFTDLKLFPNAMLSFKRLEHNCILLMLYDKEGIPTLTGGVVKTLILNRPLKIPKNEVREAVNQFEKRMNRQMVRKKK